MPMLEELVGKKQQLPVVRGLRSCHPCQRQEHGGISNGWGRVLNRELRKWCEERVVTPVLLTSLESHFMEAY